MVQQMNGERPAKARRQLVRGVRDSKSLTALLAQPEPKDVGELVQEMRKDYQVTLSENTLKAIIKTAQIKIVCDAESLSENPQDRAKADWLRDKLDELWQSRFSDMLTFIAEGRVAFEKVWSYDLQRGLHWLEDLEPLPYCETEMLLRTTGECKGDFAGIRLSVNDESIDFDPVKSWWLALDASVTHPYGRSRYCGAPHEVWQNRKELFRLRNVFANKFVIGNQIARAPSEEVIENGQALDAMADMDQALRDVMAGGSIILPADVDAVTKQFKYQVELSQGLHDGSPLDNLIDGTDVEMLRAFGLLEKCIIEGEAVGSYALVSMQMLIVRAMCDEILDQLKTSFQKYVIDKVIDANWYKGTGPSIKIGGPKLAQVPDGILIDTVKEMLKNPQLSPMLLSGAIDIVAVLEATGVPLSDVAKESVRAILEKAKSMPLGGTPQPPTGPPPEGATLANPQEPGRDDDALAGLPTLDQLSDMVAAESQSLWDDLVAEIERLHDSKLMTNQFRLDLILNQMRELRADAMTAARIIGMCSPWRPELSSPPPGFRGTQKAIALSVAGVDGPFSGDPSGIRFPFIEDAAKFLNEKKLATADSLRTMAVADKTQVFTASGVNDFPTLQALRSQVADSLAVGDSLAEFRKKLADSVNLTRSQTETLYRTNTKQAYTAGMEETIQDPDVAEAFPYVLYAATHDGRTRSTHWELDGFVCSIHDPAYEILRKALDDWNCRCTLIPLSSRQAQSKGIKTVSDIPIDVMAKYG